MDSSLPPGSSIEAAKAWGSQNAVTFTYLEQQRQLYAIAERVPENGVNKLVCSEWSVVLRVAFNAQGVSERNEVSTVGSCL